MNNNVLIPDGLGLKKVETKQNGSKWVGGVYHKIGNAMVLGPPSDHPEYETWLTKANKQISNGYKFLKVNE